MSSQPLTRIYLNLSSLDHNINLLSKLAGGTTLWPAIKANAYGHGAVPVAERLLSRGLSTLCVAHVAEALELKEAGVGASFVILSPDLGGTAEEVVKNSFEPVVGTFIQLKALSAESVHQDKPVHVHLKTDTGMGRVGFSAESAADSIKSAMGYPGVVVASVMSHFPRADEANQEYSRSQLALFTRLAEDLRSIGVPRFHISNSAAIFDLPEARFDICRPGIAMYGLSPSSGIRNPRVKDLKPVLEWKTALTQIKTVPAGRGLSYGHTFVTARESRIASVPVGYGDGLMRNLSNRMEFLIHGVRCPQVGTICMDQCLIDVSALGDTVEPGDEAVIIGQQGKEFISADKLAETLGTINYEVTTAISARVPRIPVEEN